MWETISLVCNVHLFHHGRGFFEVESSHPRAFRLVLFAITLVYFILAIYLPSLLRQPPFHSKATHLLFCPVRHALIIIIITIYPFPWQICARAREKGTQVPHSTFIPKTSASRLKVRHVLLSYLLLGLLFTTPRSFACINVWVD